MRALTSPAAQAVEIFQRHRIKPGWSEELTSHLATGIVIARPDLFVMGKALSLQDERYGIVTTWFVTVAVGELPSLLALLPFGLPYVSFRRRGEARIRTYPLDRLLALGRKIKHRHAYANS